MILEDEAAAAAPPVIAAFETRDLSIESVRLGAWQARKTKDLLLDSLVDSMRAVGQISPVVVRPVAAAAKTPGFWEVVAGHRRLLAAQRLEWPTIRAVVVDGAIDGQLAAIAQAENGERMPLAPLEEAAAIANVVALAGSIETASQVLGKPAPWIAMRARVAKLSKAWRKALAERPAIAMLSIAHLAVVARLPEADQDEALERIAWSTVIGMGVDAFRAKIEARLLRLKTAPWDTETFMHEAQHHKPKRMVTIAPCVGCPKQTGSDGLLFPDHAGGDARCLDPVCWHQRLGAFIEERIATGEKKSGEPLLLLRATYDEPGAQAPDYLQRSVPAAPAWFTKQKGWTSRRALWVDGEKAGQAVTVHLPPAKKSDGPKKKTGAAAETVAPEERLERRRTKRVCELLQARLDIADVHPIPEADLPFKTVIVQVAALFGTDRADIYFVNEPHGEAAQSKRWMPAEDPHGALWRRVAPVLHKRIAWTAPKDHVDVLRECRLLCDFIGWSFEEVMQRACDEIPARRAR